MVRIYKLIEMMKSNWSNHVNSDYNYNIFMTISTAIPMADSIAF